MDIDMHGREARRPGRTPALLCASAALGMVLLGAPAGLLWIIVAPRPELVLTRKGATSANPETHALIAADGWFAVITAVAGLLCGVLTHLLVRRHLRTRVREIAVLLGLTAGGLLASLVTRYVGRAAGFAEFHQRVRAEPPGTHVMGYLQLHAVGLLVAWPLCAVLVFTVLLAFSDTGTTTDELSDEVSHQSLDSPDASGLL